MLFVCTHNSARSQLAAALWTSRTGRRASSAGTHPAPHVHRGAIAAAQRADLSLAGAKPALLTKIPRSVQVVTVCDRVHEELEVDPNWWHWSIPDPVESGKANAFTDVLHALDERISVFVDATDKEGGRRA